MFPAPPSPMAPTAALAAAPGGWSYHSGLSGPTGPSPGGHLVSYLVISPMRVPWVDARAPPVGIKVRKPQRPRDPKVKVLVTQSCLTLCDPVDCSRPGSPVHGILQVRILEWVAIPFPRRFSQPRDRTRISCTGGGFFTV